MFFPGEFMIRLLPFFLFLLPFAGFAQSGKPKLIVGVVVDQMRYDYLSRFSAGFGKDGFNRLLTGGTTFTQAHFNYVPTYTAPGHATVYTGTTPHYHGIISNDWYEGTEEKEIYVVDDDRFETVGASGSAGKSSPHRLKSPTITDQFRIDNPNSRVFSVSIKDRAAVLPGGFMANGVWWYDGKSGNFVTSTFYRKDQPSWAEAFNRNQHPLAYMKTQWDLKSPRDLYRIQSGDEKEYEGDPFRENDRSFPHVFSALTDSEKLDRIKVTPFASDLLVKFAETLMQAEDLGRKKDPDFLAISFSAPDYIGHTYGPNSWEVMDTYLRLDDQIARLLTALDRQVGKGNYLLFLTADHAVGEAHGYLEENRIPHGFYSRKELTDSLSAFIGDRYKTPGLVLNVSNNQVFLNRDLITAKGINERDVQNTVRDWIRLHAESAGEIITRFELDGLQARRDMESMILNGWDPARSGDVAFLLRPHYLEGKLSSGATHGSPFRYDTHVPVLFYGWHVPAVRRNEPVYVVDVAATVADLLQIQMPPACIGVPLINYPKK